MRMQRLAAALVLMQLGGCQVGHAQSPKPDPVAPPQIIDQALREYPLCEASGAGWVAAAAGRDVFVVDNEVKDAIFRYRQEQNGVLVKAPTGWPLKTRTEIEDAEAIATAGEHLFLVGSHSRKKSCKRDEKRLRIAVFQEKDGALTRELLTTEKEWVDLVTHCETKLLKDVSSSSLKKEVCKAIEDGERAADAELTPKPTPKPTPEPKGDPCADRVPAFNIEGAFATTDPSGTHRLWVGLRAPILSDGSAILLRLARVSDGSSASFDAVAAIQLGGKGIRDLALDGGWVWGIAGSPLDSQAESTLFRVQGPAITDGARISADAVTLVNTNLPAGAEGLVVDGATQRAVIVVDGEVDKEAQKCQDKNKKETPARQLVLPLGKL